MNRQSETKLNSIGTGNPLPTLWLSLTTTAAVLAGAGSILGLLMSHRIYGHEVPDLFNASMAQDLVNLFLVVPVMLILVDRALHGSFRSWLLLTGFLAFTTYNYTIYAFTIHFGTLFLVWVAVLGLSIFALLGGLFALFTVPDLKNRFASSRVRFPGWFLITASLLFAFLWLSEILPDLLAGRESTSAAIWKVPTNPVHVLDLAFFLPAVLVTGVSLLRRRQAGYAYSVGSLVFLALTSLPILVTPLVARIRGGHPSWSVVPPITVVALTSLWALWWLLRGLEPNVSRAPEPI